MIDTKTHYTEENMIKLNMELNLIPITFDGIFKGIFKKRFDIVFLFIIYSLW